MNIEDKLDELLSSLGETEVLEFKEAKNTYDFGKLGKYFSALSNEANLSGKEEAWILFGIKDNRTIVGSSYRTNSMDLHSIKAEIANHTTNRITVKEIYEVSRAEGRVVLFQIPAAPKGMPIAFKGHYYGRDGD